MSYVWIKILVIFLLSLVCFFANLARSAIVSINDSSVSKKAAAGDEKAKKLLKIIKNPTPMINAVAFCFTFMSLTISAFTALSFVKWTAQKFGTHFGLYSHSTLILAVTMVAFSLALTLMLFMLCKILPEKIGAVKCQTLAYSLRGFMSLLIALGTPFASVSVHISNGILRIFGVDPHAGDEQVTEEEIMMMVDAGKEKGVIEQTQRSMINNIFQFDDLVIGEVMTHRTDIAAVENTQSVSEIIEVAIREGYSRIPVYEEDIDNIKGIIYVKDLLKFVGKKVPVKALDSVMREVYYVPESKKCADLFSEMTERHIQMCIVADEYGGTGGLITMEDLLEVIVGSMQDEYDDEQEEFTKINETTFTIDGTTLISDADDILEIELPEGEYDTVAGMIMSAIGKIPEENENPQVQIAGCLFKVLSVKDRRIDKILVKKLPPELSEDGE